MCHKFRWPLGGVLHCTGMNCIIDNNNIQYQFLHIYLGSTYLFNHSGQSNDIFGAVVIVNLIWGIADVDLSMCFAHWSSCSTIWMYPDIFV